MTKNRARLNCRVLSLFHYLVPSAPGRGRLSPLIQLRPKALQPFLHRGPVDGSLNHPPHPFGIAGCSGAGVGIGRVSSRPRIFFWRSHLLPLSHGGLLLLRRPVLGPLGLALFLTPLRLAPLLLRFTGGLLSPLRGGTLRLVLLGRIPCPTTFWIKRSTMWSCPPARWPSCG